MFIGTFKNRNPFLLILSLSILSAFTGISSAETLVSGIISTDTTWDLAGSPYIIVGVDINDDATLTLDPGVEVKFESPSAGISVYGTLNASGTSDKKIIFTSIKDDSYGGDTNGDGSVTSPSPGDWGYIYLRGDDARDGIGIFDHVIIRYGGSSSLYPANVFSRESDLFIFKNSICEYSLNNGIYLGSTYNNEINGNIFNKNNIHGLHASGGSPIIKNNIFVNNAEYAAYLVGAHITSYKNNTGTGNGKNGLGINGGVYSDQTWGASFPYIIVGVDINDDATLTLDPGVEVKFESPSAGISVYGTLNASGTSDKKIIFTSIKDDSYGGDTNGDGSVTSPSPGDWGYIYFRGDYALDGIGIFDHAIIRYGGSSSLYPANVFSRESDLFILKNSICEYSLNNGIYLGSTHNSEISGNVINSNDNGIHLISSSGNIIYLNNFINNINYNAYDSGKNLWNSSTQGNYYSDYTGTDADGDGIGDTPHPIPGGNSVDRYPLMAPYFPPPSITDGLVAEYHFDGDTQDSSGNSNHGSNHGATFVEGISGQGLSFDGLDDYFDYGTSNNFNWESTSSFTYDFWLKTTENYGMLFSQRSITSQSPVVNIALGYSGFTTFGGGEIVVLIRDDYGSVAGCFSGCTEVDSNTVVNDGNFHHIAIVRDVAEDNVKIYIDGELKSNVIDQLSAGMTTDMRTIGNEKSWVNLNFGTPDQRFFDGIIDEVRIHNRALSIEEIKEQYEQGIPIVSITVSSPNGGEDWQAGTTQTIQWSYTGNPGYNVKIELVKGDIIDHTILSSMPIGNDGSGSYEWTIQPTQISGTDYKIRVTGIDNNDYFSDLSDEYFEISTSPLIEIIKQGVIFEGIFNQDNYGTYPMIMEIKTVNGLEFNGILHWPTLGDSKTKFRGKIDSILDQIWFTEFEQIQGSSTIVLNGNYYAELENNILSGYWNFPNGENGGTFSLTPSSLASKPKIELVEIQRNRKKVSSVSMGYSYDFVVKLTNLDSKPYYYSLGMTQVKHDIPLIKAWPPEFDLKNSDIKTQLINTGETKEYRFQFNNKWKWLPDQSDTDFILGLAGLYSHDIKSNVMLTAIDFEKTYSLILDEKDQPIRVVNIEFEPKSESTKSLISADELKKTVKVEISYLDLKYSYFFNSIIFTLANDVSTFGFYAFGKNPLADFASTAVSGLLTYDAMHAYNMAVDPINDFKIVIEPEPIYFPEIESIQDPHKKELVSLYLELSSIYCALEQTYIRYAGASNANEPVYMVLQLEAAKEYSIQLIQKMEEIQRLHKILFNNAIYISEDQIISIQNHVSQNGLSNVEKDFLTREGLEDLIQFRIQRILNADPTMYTDLNKMHTLLSLTTQSFIINSEELMKEINIIKLNQLDYPELTATPQEIGELENLKSLIQNGLNDGKSYEEINNQIQLMIEKSDDLINRTNNIAYLEYYTFATRLLSENINSFEPYNITFLPPITTMDQFKLTDGSTLPIKFTARDNETGEFIWDDTINVTITNSTGHLITYFTNGTGTDSVRINATEEQYIVNFRTRDYNLITGETYTVTVTFGEADSLRGYEITYFTLIEGGKAKGRPST